MILSRFTPALEVTAPPLPPCAARPEGASWGPLGPPDELVEVPPEMQVAEPDRNLKWRVIARYASQVDCTRRDSGGHHAACGYMRAFVKRHESFWTHHFGDAAGRDAAGPVLIIAAHPDDEALGAAGVIAHARGRRGAASTSRSSPTAKGARSPPLRAERHRAPASASCAVAASSRQRSRPRSRSPAA